MVFAPITPSKIFSTPVLGSVYSEFADKVLDIFYLKSENSGRQRCKNRLPDRVPRKCLRVKFDARAARYLNQPLLAYPDSRTISGNFPLQVRDLLQTILLTVAYSIALVLREYTLYQSTITLGLPTECSLNADK